MFDDINTFLPDKHLKGQLGIRVCDITFLDQSRLVGSLCLWRHVFRSKQVIWFPLLSVKSRFWIKAGQLDPPVCDATFLDQRRSVGTTRKWKILSLNSESWSIVGIQTQNKTLNGLAALRLGQFWPSLSNKSYLIIFWSIKLQKMSGLVEHFPHQNINTLVPKVWDFHAYTYLIIKWKSYSFEICLFQKKILTPFSSVKVTRAKSHLPYNNSFGQTVFCQGNNSQRSSNLLHDWLMTLLYFTQRSLWPPSFLYFIKFNDYHDCHWYIRDSVVPQLKVHNAWKCRSWLPCQQPV